METTFTFRVDSEIKRSFEIAAKANDRTSSQLLREFMRDYCLKNAQADLLKPRANKSVKRRT